MWRTCMFMMREGKIDAKNIVCVMLGVSEESKAYSLYDPFVRKVIVSRDVVLKNKNLGVGMRVIKST